MPHLTNTLTQIGSVLSKCQILASGVCGLNSIRRDRSLGTASTVLVANSQQVFFQYEAKILPTKVGGGVLVVASLTLRDRCQVMLMIHAKTNMPNNMVGRPMGEGSWLGHRLLCETGVRLTCLPRPSLCRIYLPCT